MRLGLSGGTPQWPKNVNPSSSVSDERLELTKLYSGRSHTMYVLCKSLPWPANFG